jgi:hypothetical protein
MSLPTFLLVGIGVPVLLFFFLLWLVARKVPS